MIIKILILYIFLSFNYIYSNYNQLCQIYSKYYKIEYNKQIKQLYPNNIIPFYEFPHNLIFDDCKRLFQINKQYNIYKVKYFSKILANMYSQSIKSKIRLIKLNNDNCCWQWFIYFKFGYIYDYYYYLIYPEKEKNKCKVLKNLSIKNIKDITYNDLKEK